LTHGISLHKKLPTDSEECISRDPPVRKIQDYKLGEREEKMREEGNAPILNLPTEKAKEEPERSFIMDHEQKIFQIQSFNENEHCLLPYMHHTSC
jgi:hypothetical protein